MADQTQAASSPAEVDVFNGQQPTMAEYSQYRESGEVPERFKPAAPADPAPADKPEEKAPADEESEIEPASEPDEAQEQPQKGSAAEKRIKQLLAKTKELERKLADAAKPTQSDSSTAQASPQTYQDYRKAFKPSLFIEEYAKANPEASYEDANAAMADHLLDVREHFQKIESRVNAEKQALESKVSEARSRYDNFDEIKETFLSKVISDKGAPLIPLPVLALINDSDYLADVLYTIGSDDAELAKFVEMAKTNPNKAIRYVTKVEGLIAAELAKPKETPVRAENGQFKPKAPEKQQTSAPKPPSPVSGGSSRAFDVNDESLSSEQWMRNRNKQLGIG